MRVVALFRVSTEKQATDGASLDAQERAYRAMADRSGWTTVQEFKGCESASGRPAIGVSCSRCSPVSVTPSPTRSG
jgi:DNA invertase Pin-like site-specific DNA recombinase